MLMCRVIALFIVSKGFASLDLIFGEALLAADLITACKVLHVPSATNPFLDPAVQKSILPREWQISIAASLMRRQVDKRLQYWQANRLHKPFEGDVVVQAANASTHARYKPHRMNG